MLMLGPYIWGGQRISAKPEASINKHTILTTCNKVRNENSKVDIHVETPKQVLCAMRTNLSNK